MNALDHRLHAWLVEPDDRRFELAFNAYFAVAFPAVVRYLARVSRWEPARLEDLAQEALLRFFDRVGRARRDASRTIVRALADLRSPGLGPFHERQLRAWIDDVAEFAEAAIRFRIRRDEDESKAAVQELLERIAPLQRQGQQLVNAALQAPERQLPDVEAFRGALSLVIDRLPQLRIPTNSYLFQIARSVYLDECKKQGRQKRGGAAPEPLDDVLAMVEEGQDDSLPLPVNTTGLAVPREPTVDPAAEYESEEFFRKFQEYLRAPLDQAAEAYERAAAEGSAAPERRKLESLTKKYTRTVSVIAGIGEGHTQEQIAEQLDLSRNQVKYIIELVQEAYARFASNSAGLSPASPTEREQSYVP
jgi:DNA-directed RNA polymerase specialized sigma24 family protein